MDIGRFTGALGAEEHATHMRISEYVRKICDRYPATGFTPAQEWVVERTIDALRTMLTQVRCTDEERQAVLDFLALASETLPGPP